MAETADQNIINNRSEILVVGAGISGITTAIEAAEAGYKVILVETKNFIGGKAIEMNKYFPKLCPPYCGMEINFQRIKKNTGITLFTSSKVTKVKGKAGNFDVCIETHPEFVNSNCTLCNKCTEVCPIDIADTYNYGMNKTKAIYLSHDLAFPERYSIDNDLCNKTQCNKCVEVCTYDAIDFSQEIKHIDIKVGAIVFTNGWDVYNAGKIDNLKFGRHSDIVTNMMLERILSPNGPTNGKVSFGKDNQVPEKIAFVQCAGSRDEKHLSYCSGVCCSASLKQALSLVDKIESVEISIFYIDIRLSGRNEDFLNKVESHPRINLIKGKAASVDIDSHNKNLSVIFEDIFAGKKEEKDFDLIVLATGIVPNNEKLDIIKYNSEGFIITEDLPLGIYAAGCSKRPMDISTSVKDATGAALKAIQSVI